MNILLLIILVLSLLLCSCCKKFAYVTLIGGVGDTRTDFGFILNALVNKRRLLSLQSDVDLVVLVHFGERGREELLWDEKALLDHFNIKTKLLPPFVGETDFMTYLMF